MERSTTSKALCLAVALVGHSLLGLIGAAESAPAGEDFPNRPVGEPIIPLPLATARAIPSIDTFPAYQGCERSTTNVIASSGPLASRARTHRGV